MPEVVKKAIEALREISEKDLWSDLANAIDNSEESMDIIQGLEEIVNGEV